MHDYKVESYCSPCGKWRLKGIWCPKCKMRMRNHARNKSARCDSQVRRASAPRSRSNKSGRDFRNITINND